MTLWKAQKKPTSSSSFLFFLRIIRKLAVTLSHACVGSRPAELGSAGWWGAGRESGAKGGAGARGGGVGGPRGT